MTPVTVPETLDVKKARLFKAMTERLGHEPVRRSHDSHGHSKGPEGWKCL